MRSAKILDVFWRWSRQDFLMRWLWVWTKERSQGWTVNINSKPPATDLSTLLPTYFCIYFYENRGSAPKWEKEGPFLPSHRLSAPAPRWARGGSGHRRCRSPGRACNALRSAKTATPVRPARLPQRHSRRPGGAWAASSAWQSHHPKPALL